MLTHLEQMHHMCEQQDQIIRFHSLQNKTKDVPVIPWKLEIEMKKINALVGNTVWQLVSLRIKRHHLAQCRLADVDEADKSKILQREKVCLCLMDIILGNDDVQCYVNTVFLTVWWIHLLSLDFEIETWGEWTGRHQDLLLTASLDPLCIRAHPFFRDVLQQWENLRAHGQQDYGEFLCFYLGWLGATLVSQAYHRRFLTAESGIVTAEKNAGFAPFLLHSDLWEDDPVFPNFQAIVDRWTQMNGMTTALVIASRLVCFQVCRFQSMTVADRTAFNFGELEVYVTVFTDVGMNTARMAYRIIAFVGYTGDSWRGHYTCAVAFCNSYGEPRWLCHDDNKRP